MLRKRTSRSAAAKLEARMLEIRGLLEDADRPMEDKLRMVQAIRAESAQDAGHLDQFLVAEVTRLRDGLHVAQTQQRKLRQVLDTFTSSPWLPGILVELTETPRGQRAVVSAAGSFRVVPVDDAVDPSTLASGDEVFLAKDSGILAAKAICPALRCGETAAVARMLPDDRLVIKWRDEEVVVRLAASMRHVSLTAGDLVRWDRGAWMAFEKVSTTAVPISFWRRRLVSRSTTLADSTRRSRRCVVASSSTTSIPRSRAAIGFGPSARSCSPALRGRARR